MKILPLLLAVFAMFAVAPAHAAPEIGEPAPDFTATDAKGETVNLAALKGKTVVLEWTNPGCPFVMKHYDSKNMQAIQEKATADGVVWIVVNSSAEGKEGSLSNEEAGKYLADNGAHASHYVVDKDGVIGKLYDAKTTPHMFVVDKDGNLAYMGAIDDNDSPRESSVKGAKNYVTEALAALKDGREVETASTQPYGCGVKY